MNPNQNPNTQSFKISLRLVCLSLLLIIVGMLALWRPWQHSTSVTRKISITGSATVTAMPDEFVFYPSFERTGTDLSILKNDLNTYGTKLQSDILKLGVAKSDITLDSSSYASFDYRPVDSATNNSQTITLQVTITARNQVVAQKVQDYLAGTDAKGQLTSQPQFSDNKQKDLENTARQKAIQSARSQASQTATNLGGKLGKVLEVTDQQGTGIIEPLAVSAGAKSAAGKTSLPVTPGENQVTASVQVVFTLQ